MVQTIKVIKNVSKENCKRIALENIETSIDSIQKGDIVEGFKNSYHLLGCESIQVEMTQECGGVGSGIVVVHVPVKLI